MVFKRLLQCPLQHMQVQKPKYAETETDGVVNVISGRQAVKYNPVATGLTERCSH